MCGRYASFREAQDLADAFAVDEVADDARLLPASWNLAPTDPVRVVVERAKDDEARRSLRVVRWGLVPGWAKDPSVGSRMINARVETLTTKPAFRKTAAARRCLVPAEGYFEWQARGEEGADGASGGRTAGGSRGGRAARKQPFWIHPADGGILAFAGLYEFWRDPERADDDPLRWLVTMTIVTGDATTQDPALAAIHDRRPVILPPEAWDAWLDPALTDPDGVLNVLRRDPPALVARPVSTDVSSVHNDGPHLLDAVPLPDDVPATFDLPLELPPA